MLDIQLTTEEARHVAVHESVDMLNALELEPTPANLLAVGWTFARGEFEGLRVEMPVRMACLGVCVAL